MQGLPVLIHSPSSGDTRLTQDGKPVVSAGELECTQKEGEKGSSVASKAMAELSSMQLHAEAFGSYLRMLASATAPDGLKGLSSIEQRVLSFAGTPKVFAALHELEQAVAAINLHGAGAAGSKLH